MGMATIILTDLDDRLVDQARKGVEALGGSLEDELRRLVEQRAREADADQRRRAEEAIASMKAYAERMHAKYGPLPPTSEMLRQERESW